ncbi:hypothetical protein ABPG75_005798 [Micractinium tetrahymenae]
MRRCSGQHSWELTGSCVSGGGRTKQRPTWGQRRRARAAQMYGCRLFVRLERDQVCALRMQWPREAAAANAILSDCRAAAPPPPQPVPDGRWGLAGAALDLKMLGPGDDVRLLCKNVENSSNLRSSTSL